MNVKNVSYLGVFTQHIDGKLAKDIPNQHITLAFQPTDEQFKELLPLLGCDCSYKVIGYGNDGKNEGLQVILQPNTPYFGQEQQHITLSIAKDGKAVDTGSLEFNEHIPSELGISEGTILTGKIGAFTKDREIEYHGYKFEEMGEMKTQQIKDLAAKISVDNYKMPLSTESIQLDKLLYRVNDGEWQKCTDEVINNISKIEGQLDLQIEDGNKSLLISNLIDGVCVNGMTENENYIVLIGENSCWANVNFEKEFYERKENAEKVICDISQNEMEEEIGIEIE